jgi:hypothetical protein
MPTNAALKFKFTPNKFDAKVYELITLWEFASQFATIIDNAAPEGRLKSLVMSELEKTVALAQRAITEG